MDIGYWVGKKICASFFFKLPKIWSQNSRIYFIIAPHYIRYWRPKYETSKTYQIKETFWVTQYPLLLLLIVTLVIVCFLWNFLSRFSLSNIFGGILSNHILHVLKQSMRGPTRERGNQFENKCWFIYIIPSLQKDSYQLKQNG